MQTYKALGGDPWRWPPATVNKLTDFQIWELYLKPAIKTSRRANRGPSGRLSSDKWGRATRLPKRDEYIQFGKALGGDPEDLGKAFDRWEATRPMKR